MLAALPVAVLIVLLALHSQLDLDADPLRIAIAVFGGLLTVAVAARYPAAFVAPALFLPSMYQTSGAPALRGLGPAGNWTELEIICGLLVIGVLLHRFFIAPDPGDETSALNKERNTSAAVSHASPLRHSRLAILAFALFATIVCFSFAYTLSPDYGQNKLIWFLALGCGSFLLPAVLFTGRRDFRDFIFGTAIFGFIVALSSLKFSATGAMAEGANPAHIGKGQAIGLAMLLLLYAPINSRRLRAFVLLGCIPFLAVGLVSAETRGPLFSLLLVLALGFFLPSMRSRLLTRRQMLFAAAALVGAVMLLSTFWFYGDEASKFQYKATEILALVQGNNEAKGTAVERLQFYHEASQVWTKHPLFGWGLGSWSMIYWQQDIRQYPHNLFWEVLVEQGLTGLAALALFLFAVFRQLHECRKDTAAPFPFLLPCLVYLISIALFSGDLVDDRFIWFWCGLALTACALAQHARNRAPQFATSMGKRRSSQLSSAHDQPSFSG